jgi:DNA replication and repair protein RecF
MHIRYISLTNFRNYTRLELALPRSPLLLYGANAQGKTNLLEAVHLLSSGSSALTSVERQLIRWGAVEEGLPYARVWAEVVRGNQVHELEVVLEKRKNGNGSDRLLKTHRVDRKRKQRVDFIGRLNVVLFMPQDMELIAGAPAQRRRYIDDTLSQVDANYAASLDRYKEALRQRNAALRYLREGNGDPAQLQPFETILANEGIRIVKGRRQLMAVLSRRADHIHQQLTGAADWLRLAYVPNFDPTAPLEREHQSSLGLISRQDLPIEAADDELISAFQDALQTRRAEEIARGTTVVGPHRDEFRVLSGNPAQGTHEVDLGTFGSRGQQRTAVLALKLAELDWMSAVTGESPVLLLDEVLAELDADRRAYLLDQLNEVEQALLTATDVEMFSTAFRQRAALWQVNAGIVDTGSGTLASD